MADSFFGFDTSLEGGGLEDGIDGPLEDDDFGEEEEYDALNDETFGSEATIGDWEQDHEKLAQITESTRPQVQNTSNNKNGNVDVGENLSHLVLDDKEGTVPRPGVWDSPINLPLPQTQAPPPLPTLKKVCTVEELERGLIANRPPPGLTKPSQSQQQPGGSFLFDSLPLNEQLPVNGVPPHRFPHGLMLPGPHSVVLPPNVRVPHSQFIQNSRLMKREYDEYAGLMSSREKQWLINIQLMQLNTNQPYIDDYYYTVFCDRQNKQHENQDNRDRRIHNNNGFHRDSREREQPHVLTKVVYTPMQFENSLGKLQCGSVTAPRKIIDMDVVSNNDSQQVPPQQQKDTKKTRQLLLETERLYTIQLKLEDTNNPLALLAEQQQHQKEGESEAKAIKKTKPELCSMILASLLQLLKDDKLASMLSIRKGKTLLLRFLPHLSVTEYGNQLGELWTGILRGLAVIGRRDGHLLSNLYPEFQRWIQTVTDFSVLLRMGKALSESSNQPAKNNSLAFALVNKFGVSVIASVLEQAEALFPVEESLACEWSSFMVTLVETVGATPPSVAPCQPIAANTLNQHLNRIHTLKIERYAPLELLLTDANPSR
ncbi:protein PAT1 homolog 1 isoform X2 [Orussus abietinus]|uniref:protein PAT1 homolog 1 isoform X2 n=1 Tax=Orussus abietinus TaxID=222816 RepID=UPI000625C59F|nr:protein PAT1 homolog 1 isoform X2 [Orussus abietinus]